MKLAVFAVNDINVNWWHEAVIAAKGYMSGGQGFSYQGLVDQLDSPYGSQFTVAGRLSTPPEPSGSGPDRPEGPRQPA